MIRYPDALDDLVADALRGGFFEGWSDPPSPETHLRIINNNDEVILAFDGPDVVGFVTSITDGVLCAYLPLLGCCPATETGGSGTS